MAVFVNLISECRSFPTLSCDILMGPFLSTVGGLASMEPWKSPKVSEN